MATFDDVRRISVDLDRILLHELAVLLREAWRMTAPKKLAASVRA